MGLMKQKVYQELVTPQRWISRYRETADCAHAGWEELEDANTASRLELPYSYNRFLHSGHESARELPVPLTVSRLCVHCVWMRSSSTSRKASIAVSSHHQLHLWSCGCIVKPIDQQDTARCTYFSKQEVMYK